MAYRVGKREDVAEGLLRLLRADLDSAVRHLASRKRLQDRVHSARRRLKRARTILRTLEPKYGGAAVALRRTITESARLMARARDAAVAAESARALAEVSAHSDAEFHRVVDTLEKEASRAHRERTPVDEITARLRKAQAEVARFDPNFDGIALLAEGLRKTYAKGRRAMKRADSSLSTPDLHRWRKAVKDLWHILLVARKRTRRTTRRRAAELDRLAELLGDDNDHALLAEKLALSLTGDPKLMSQLGVIARRRNALEAEAFALGRRLFAHRPKAFARKFAVR